MTTARELAAQRAQTDGTDSLDFLVGSKAELGSVKRRAFGELVKLSRMLVGLTLLADDFNGAADLDEVLASLRKERDTLLAERNAISADVAKLRATSTDLRTRNAELTEQVEQATTRVEQLETAERSLAAALQQYNTAVGRQDEIAAAIEQAERNLAGLRAEEARLGPIVREHHEIERKLPQAQDRLAAIEEKLAAIRQSI
jgi:chromosome segregation ATPase